MNSRRDLASKISVWRSEIVKGIWEANGKHDTQD